MKITLSKLSTKNLATLAQRVIANIQSGKYPVIASHPLTLALQSSYEEYDEVYMKKIYSGKGNDVAAADDQRDAAYSNLKAFLKGYRQLTSAPNHQLADDLYIVFQNFAINVGHVSYSEQTARMKKLIEELELPANAQKITTLSLNAAFTELKTTHIDFEELFAEQAEANAELRQMTSATAIRQHLEQNLKTYFNLLTAMKNVSGWEMLYSDTNEIVKAAKESDMGKPRADSPVS